MQESGAKLLQTNQWLQYLCLSSSLITGRGPSPCHLALLGQVLPPCITRDTRDTTWYQLYFHLLNGYGIPIPTVDLER